MGYRFDYTCMLFLAMCHLSGATRFVITFHESNPCQRAASLPTCATMVKCYSRRLVINTDACNVAQSDVSAWMDNVFGNGTVKMFEEDSLIVPNSHPVLKVHGSMLTVHGSEIELMTIVTTLTLESLGWALLPLYWFQLIPPCAYIFWSFESIVEVDVARCRIHPTNITEWVETSFANTTQTSIDIVDISRDTIEAPLDTITGTSNVISFESSIWKDRWWPVSGPHGLRATEVWEFTNASSETVIAILDSGLPFLATPLFANIAEGYDFISDVTMSNDGDGRDTNWEDPGDSSVECPGPSSWHGTQVAAVLSATNMDEFRGVATNATIMPIRVLGLCQTGHASDVADAIVWAVGGAIDNVATNPLPASIISMSFSGLGQCPSYLQSAVNQAIATGGILLAAAGNNGASSVDYFPGNCVGVIAVEASTKSGVLASYSNTHGTLAAPGGDASNPVVTISLLETSLAVVAVMGTSLSVPMVAGFLALGIDMYGHDFNPGNTLTSFTDDCAVEVCGPGIVSFYGDAHAILVVDNSSYYKCSPSASSYRDTVVSLNTTTAEWRSSEVTCIDALVTSSAAIMSFECCGAIAISQSIGRYHMCAVLQDTSIACWSAHTLSNTQLQCLGELATSSNKRTPNAISNPPSLGWVEVDTGKRTTCARKTDGTVWCWGLVVSQSSQILGFNSVIGSRNTPVKISIPDGKIAVRLAMGLYHACAVVRDVSGDQEVICWGGNDVQQCRPSAALAGSAVEFPTGLKPVDIAAGERTSCAILQDGAVNKVKCWGYDAEGLASGRGTSAPNTYQATPGPDIDVGGISVVQISMSRYQACVLCIDGNVWCWGYNYQATATTIGILGRTGLDYFSPSKVENLEPVAQISVGTMVSCAILVDGNVKCWGSDGFRGDNTFGFISTLGGIVDLGGIRAVDITCGMMSCCVVLTGGQTKCWGHYKYTQGYITTGDIGNQITSPGDSLHLADDCSAGTCPTGGIFEGECSSTSRTYGCNCDGGCETDDDDVVDSGDIPSSSSSSYSSSSMSSFSSSSSSSSSSSNEHCGVRHVWSNSQCVACSSRDVIPEEDVDSYENTQIFHADGSTTWNTYIYLKQALSVSGIFHTGVTHFTVKYSKTSPPTSFMHSAHEEATGSNVFTSSSGDCTVGFSLFKTAYTVTALLITQIEPTDAPTMRLAVQICDI